MRPAASPERHPFCAHDRPHPLPQDGERLVVPKPRLVVGEAVVEQLVCCGVHRQSDGLTGLVCCLSVAEALYHAIQAYSSAAGHLASVAGLVPKVRCRRAPRPAGLGDRQPLARDRRWAWAGACHGLCGSRFAGPRPRAWHACLRWVIATPGRAGVAGVHKPPKAAIRAPAFALWRGRSHVSSRSLEERPPSEAAGSLAAWTPDMGDAGWSSPVARQAHNLKVVGSNPTPATTLI